MQQSQPERVGDEVRISGRTMRIPGYRLLREVGRGANAVVFEAHDEALSRSVAVKIWNGRGIPRAQSEASKIASMSHPLVVSTYSFGRIEDHPFCVMEMVPGVSGKEWVKQNPPIEARLSVWGLYSEALRYIHSAIGVHGDPHLGNLLVATKLPGAKIVDAGTSEFWSDHSKIEAREGNLIVETASRLFAQENFAELWKQPRGLDYKRTLDILQVLARYLAVVYGPVDWDRRSGNADILADLITQTPFFKLDVVFLQIQETGITTANRLAARINARLLRIHNVLDAGDEINHRTQELYEAAAARSAASLAKAGLRDH